MEDIKYVRDAHGHVYIYVSVHHLSRIGSGLEFVDPPESKPGVVARKIRTLQELREVAKDEGLDIPDGTPFGKAQNIYAAFLNARKEAAVSLGDFNVAGEAVN